MTQIDDTGKKANVHNGNRGGSGSLNLYRINPIRGEIQQYHPPAAEKAHLEYLLAYR